MHHLVPHALQRHGFSAGPLRQQGVLVVKQWSQVLTFPWLIIVMI